MKTFRLSLLLGALLTVGYLPAHAFWSKILTTFRIHQDITARALDGDWTFGGAAYQFTDDAIDEINAMHPAMDSDPYDAADHFDSDEFAASVAKLADRYSQLMDELTNKPSPDSAVVHGLLGAILHGVQDFYSHSNWIQSGHQQDIVDFGNTLSGGSSSVSLTPAPGDVCTSDGSALLPNAGPFTTGFYNISPLPTGRCQHGKIWYAVAGCLLLPEGGSAGGLPPDGINHDHPCFTDGENINIFATAVVLAQRESEALIQSIVSQLDSKKKSAGFCALLGLDSSETPCQTPPDPGQCASQDSCVTWSIDGTVFGNADPCDTSIQYNYCAVAGLTATTPFTGSTPLNYVEFSLPLSDGQQIDDWRTSGLPIGQPLTSPTFTLLLAGNDPLALTNNQGEALVGFITKQLVSNPPSTYPDHSLQTSAGYLQNNPSGLPGAVTVSFQVVPVGDPSSCQNSCLAANVYAVGSFDTYVDDSAILYQTHTSIGPHHLTGTFKFMDFTCYVLGFPNPPSTLLCPTGGF
jgi:hypothetical protein